MFFIINAIESGETKNPEFRSLIELCRIKGLNDHELVSFVNEYIGQDDENEHVDLIKWIMQTFRPDLNSTTTTEGPFLNHILRKSITFETLDIETLKVFLNAGADVNKFWNQATPLSLTMKSYSNPVEFLALFVDYGLKFYSRQPEDESLRPFNLAELLKKAIHEAFDMRTGILHPPVAKDVHKVVREALKQDETFIDDSTTDNLSVFDLAPDLDTLEFLVSYVDNYEVIVGSLGRKVTVMSYLYFRRQYDCIEFLLSLEGDINMGVGKMFAFVHRDTLDYLDIQAQVDALIAKRVPTGSLDPGVPHDKLLEYFNDSTINDGYFEYILQNKYAVQLFQMLNTIRGEPGKYHQKNTLISRIIQQRKQTREQTERQ